MLQFFPLPQNKVVLARLRSKITFIKQLLLSSILLLGLCTVGVVEAQSVNMPTVNVTGINATSDGASILIIIIKFIARIAIWIVMALAGLVALKTILKSWNEQKTNDQGKWGVVVGDSLGSVVMVILVIALGTWILTFLT